MERVTATFTLIDGTQAHEVKVRVEGRSVRLSPETVRRVLGWSLEPEGLCRGDTCVAVRDRKALVRSDGLDLEALARVLDRPLALDPEERAAALGIPASERAAALASLEAPDFTLPDLQGRLHSLSDHRGKKVLLVAYASW